MNWKDYLYFQRGDKTAIILLLILILLAGILYAVSYPKQTRTQPENISDNNRFEAFIANMKYTEDTETQAKQDRHKNSPPLYQQKLKAGETIELNSADTTALKKIPKIGRGFANRIVKYRELLGGFNHIEQLKEVWGMDDYLFDDIKPYMTLTAKSRKIKINSASFRELAKHPYINYKQAQAITDIRERKGAIGSIGRLELLDEFSEKDIKRLSPYLSFD
ncbi:helix-hairpin-helix domain-containing protein [Dysgonomonas sp. 511]|uniref:ComEA family DNA-binding protein n=1 Tax=Dysgonomonas sp. 511 TaxID=2302930 RepID=UPI0013D06DC5|nr:helix-hairpin-helix domain-containing protein [Dysgonomonas sp. 511]NDV78664.1 helix-hairpin-helix domain-containing protein [Dysgonomonas sp. 511]